MPEQIHTDFKRLLLALFNGTGTRPVTIYMGLRIDSPGATNTLSSISELGSVTPAGYSRIAITTSSITNSTTGNDAVLAIPQQSFPAFTATPSPNLATHWFLCSAASGTTGSLYASGPLNPGEVSGTLQSAASSGQPVISILTSLATLLLNGDYLNIGTACKNNKEVVQVFSFGVASAGVTPVTLAANLTFTHPLGEVWNRDGSSRAYYSTYTEKVTASIQMTSV